MPFGLAIAPRVFTKMMLALGGFFRYLDDWLVRNQDQRILSQQVVLIQDLLQDLGLFLNYQKSQLIPSQKAMYLGALFNLK